MEPQDTREVSQAETDLEIAENELTEEEEDQALAEAMEIAEHQEVLDLIVVLSTFKLAIEDLNNRLKAVENRLPKMVVPRGR